jgi:cytochrome c5
MKNLYTVFFLLGIIVACSPKVAETIVVEQTTEASSLAEVPEGKQLFESNCVRCHKLKNPGDFSTEEWKEIVPRMAEKAKIDETTKGKILEYVLANAKQ